jgi:hypothetical protein
VGTYCLLRVEIPSFKVSSNEVNIYAVPLTSVLKVRIFNAIAFVTAGNYQNMFTVKLDYYVIATPITLLFKIHAA